MSENRTTSVSTWQFVCEIMKYYGVQTEDVITYGYNAGWLDDQDVTGRALLLERRNAARIVHQFMLMELKEPDMAKVDAAAKLQDLYECRSCVGHVMQIYSKGIMEGHTDNAGRFVFGMREQVSVKECCEVVERLFNIERRLSQITDIITEVEVITEEQALQYLKEDKKVLLIDVRMADEFEGRHIEGAANIPLAYILKNPYVVGERRDVRILLYCEEGYQSEIAARCLSEAGYEKVYCFASKEIG
ncbi:MAG: rhodanese-like domain-containing protein [Lachnospiraceae bacterium]|nr:rhodanese-like domain-containing protein [Lachnospiraceae bacterium]